MSDELVFYTNPMSRGQIVRWMLEEVGQPYRTELLDYATTMKAPAFLAVNPMGKVPAIQHRGQVVTEAAAICAYLADAFPQAGLAPSLGSAERAPYLRWLFFAAGPLEAASTNAYCKFEASVEQSRMLGYGSLAAALDAIELGVRGALDGSGFLAGDRFSAADLYAACQLGFLTEFGMVERRPAFMAFIEKMTSRPAKQRAQAIDDALIAKARAAAAAL